MSCPRFTRGKDLVCIGSMKSLITIIPRAITPDTIGYAETLTGGVQVRALINTKTQTVIMDNVNTDSVVTHIFFIRYGQTVEKNYTILHDGKYYGVMGVENLEMENRFLRITAIERGSTSKAANF